MAESKSSTLDLKHNVGDTLQLQFSPGKAEDRYYVKLIGYLEDKSIIVTAPRSDGVPVQIPAQQKFIVRMISGNSAQGFTAHAIHFTKHPYPHLHLAFPTDLESITVRKAERIGCKLIVTVHNETPGKALPDGISATMENLSTVGAQLTSNESIGAQEDSILISCKVTVAELELYLNIAGIIRRVTDKSAGENVSTEYGIEFSALEDNDKLLLHSFIYEQLLNISN